MEHQRQLAYAGEPGVRIGRFDAVENARIGIREMPERREVIGKTRSMRQQVEQRDRRADGFCALERAAGILENHGVRQFRQPARDGIIQP
jgi:hypothetical protein